MNKGTYCNNEDILNIILDYKNGKTVKDISNKYSRAMSTVIAKLTEAGVYKQRNLNLTEEDMAFIKEKYSNGELNDIFTAYPKLKKERLLRLMSDNKVRSNFKWSKDEENILMDNYEEVNIDEICRMLPNRNKKSIQTKAAKLGLTKSRLWTKEEDDILYDNYATMKINDICTLIPNRSRNAIILHAERLGLKNLIDYKNEQYKILVDNFDCKTDEELAAMIGCSKRTVLANRVKYCLFKNNYERECSSHLSAYIRENNNEWKLESMKNCNYMCVISNKKFDDIHHIYGFNLIFSEMIENIPFELNRSFKDFSDDELKCILDEFKKVQSKYPLGVCLSKDIHSEFHKQYGYGYNDEKQWNEFVKNIKKIIA